jgi:hypothetical protein
MAQCAAGLANFGPEDIKAVSADGLLTRKAGHLLSSAVECSDPTVVIRGEHTVRDGIKDDRRDPTGGRFHVLSRLASMISASRTSNRLTVALVSA